MPDVEFPECREDGADVLDERLARPDHQDAGPRQPVAERVQQPGRAVQPDSGLAGTGRTLYAQALGDVCPDDFVLLRLDGRDDVAHRPGAGPLDLGGEDPGAAVVHGRGLEVLVLVRGQRPAFDTEAAPPSHPHRLGAARPVEGAGDVGAPVDDHGVATGVGHVTATDVPAGAVVVVGPAEEQGGARVVDEGGDPRAQAGRQELRGDPVATVGLEGRRALAHPGQLAASPGQVRLLGGEDVHGDRLSGMGLLAAGRRHIGGGADDSRLRALRPRPHRAG